MGVRLPKGNLHLGDGIRGVADYPAEIRVKALKLVNTLKGTSPQLLNLLCHQVMGHQQHTLYLNLKTTLQIIACQADTIVLLFFS